MDSNIRSNNPILKGVVRSAAYLWVMAALRSVFLIASLHGNSVLSSPKYHIFHYKMGIEFSNLDSFNSSCRAGEQTDINFLKATTLNQRLQFNVSQT